MFCLRRSVITFPHFTTFLLHSLKPQANIRHSWLPLFFIPTNASPIFVFLFFVCTFLLNRPCVYCSFLLIILIASSCNWSDHCFFDFSKNWFEPTSTGSYYGTSNSSLAGMAFEGAMKWGSVANDTASAIGVIAAQEAQKALPGRPEWTGIGLGWLRSLLGRREWTLPCVDVKIRL